jgi:hypothetical protein
MTFFGPDGEKYIGIPFERISMLAAEHTIVERVAREVRIALAEDESFRILVREGVRNAMVHLNIAEVVTLAVKDLINVELAKMEKRTP